MRSVVGVLVAGLMLAATLAVAGSHFQNYIPLGDETLPGNSSSCQTCHVSTNGGLLNDFGIDVRTTLKDGKPDWSVLANMDSDDDGVSNGSELGDPTGTWTPGSANPNGTITNPANKASYSVAPLAVQRVQVPTTWAVIKALFQ